MEKHIKVRLFLHENDSYNEVWKVKDEEKYFARYTAFGGFWYHVSDPLGYCELDHSCSEDLIFHVCDKNWNELFTSSNKDNTCHFSRLKDVVETQWDKFYKSNKDKEKISLQFEKLKEYLLSYRDPDIYGKETETYSENWLFFMREELSSETVSSFEYLGEDYYIKKCHYKHTVCEVEWDEFIVADYCMGYVFDESHFGTMYSKNKGNNLVADALINKFKVNRLSYVQKYDTVIKEQKVLTYDAAKILISGNYHRVYIDDLINAIVDNPTQLFLYLNDKEFYLNFNILKNKYPEAIQNYRTIY